MLPGTENVLGPPVFWSPDSRFIAFQSGNRLKKIDISGGPPQDICDASVSVIGGAWNRDGVIIFGTEGNGIMQVPATGGVPVSRTTTGGRNESSHISVFPVRPAAFFLSESTGESRYLPRVTRC